MRIGGVDDEQVAAGVDEQAGVCGGAQPLHLFRRVDHLAGSGPLVLHVDANDAGGRRRRDRAGDFGGICAIASLEIEGHRQIHCADDAARVVEHQRHRHGFTILQAIGLGHAIAAGGDGPCPCRRDSARTACIPDIVEQQRFARHVQAGEMLDGVGHWLASLSSNLALRSNP